MLPIQNNQKALWKVGSTFFFFNEIMQLLILKPAMINQSEKGEDLEVRADFNAAWNLFSVPCQRKEQNTVKWFPLLNDAMFKEEDNSWNVLGFFLVLFKNCEGTVKTPILPPLCFLCLSKSHKMLMQDLLSPDLQFIWSE